MLKRVDSLKKDPASSSLSRGISRGSLIAILVNLFIGAGIFGLPSRAFALAGSYSVLALVICGGLIGLIVLCFLEVGSRFPGTGGPYLYARKTFGRLTGFQVGWLLWLTRITSFAIICDILLSYLSVIWPTVNEGITRTLLVTAIVIVLTTINYLGVRHAARMSNVFAIMKLLPLAMFILVGIWFIEPGNFQFQPIPNTNTLALAVMVLIFAFSGFEVATINAGEVQNPGKAFPYALFFTVTLVLVFYLAIQIVAIGTLPSLATSTRPLADAATMFVGPIGAAVIVVGAIISTSGTLNAGLLGGSRLPYAMARENQAPSFFGQTHTKYHTPTSSLIITAFACWLACLTFNFVEALTINSVIRLITYAIVCAALPVLRRRPDTSPPNYVVRMGPWVSGSALLLCAWLLSQVSVAEVMQVSGAIVLGGILYGLSAIRR